MNRSYHIDTHPQKFTQTHTLTHRYSLRQTDTKNTQTVRHKHSETDKQTLTQTLRHSHTQTIRPKHTNTNRLITHKLKHTHTDIHNPILTLTHTDKQTELIEFSLDKDSKSLYICD